MNKLKIFLKNYGFIILIIILSIIRLLIVDNFPIIALAGAGEDDALMVKWAYSLLDGKYLGNYEYNTLMKGPVFSAILVCIYKFGLEYIATVTLFYICSCITLIIALNKLFKNKYLLTLFYAIILFNPIMFSHEILQRVYRNSLIPSFAVLIPACYIGIFVRIKDSIWKIIPWSLIASVSLCLFYYTREDSMWIIPFIIFMTIAIIIGKIIAEKKCNTKLISMIILVILPIVSLSWFGNYIARKNELFYGVKTKNILSDSNFTKALSAIYAVRPNSNIDSVTVTQEKIRRMAAVSPAMNSITPYLIETIGGFGSLDRKPGDGEVEDGWVLWAIRQAVIKAGCVTIEQEQEFYEKVAEELNEAMDKGLLERQKIMPSPLLSPYKKGYAYKTIKAVIKSFIYVAEYKDVAITTDTISDISPNVYKEIKRFENISGNRAIYVEGTTDENGEIISELKTQEDYINSLSFKKNLINGIIKIYSYTGIITFGIGTVLYIILSVKMIQGLFKKDFYNVEKWVVISGILGALFTLIAGISYNEVATAYSIKVLYLCGAYPLFIAFCMLNIFLNVSKKQKILDKEMEKIEEE